jgi:photosystem II stability/assembly factor-like uncharacterized protein
MNKKYALKDLLRIKKIKAGEMRILSLSFFLSLLLAGNAQNDSCLFTDLNVNTSIRGLSVVDDSVAWISGSNGWIGRSMDSGRNWEMHQVVNYETLNFRSIFAFDKNNALIASAGTPAVILATYDGGKSWITAYSNTDTLAFLDGMDFRNSKEGIVYGDPVNGQMMILKTVDGGKHWTQNNEAPLLKDGESSFAASGTGIRLSGKNEILIATGGLISRIFYSADNGKTWKIFTPSFVHGQKSTGIFSLASDNRKTIIAVGGDYLTDTIRTDHIYYSTDKGNSWLKPLTPTRGYRECVEVIRANTYIAAGPSGMDISYDNGKNWQPFSDEQGFHVIRKARTGRLVLAAGKGRVMIFRN